MAVSTQTVLRDAVIFTGEAFVENHALVVDNHKIVDIVSTTKAPDHANHVSFPGKILAPGFIDAQVNGGGNVFLNNAPTAESCLAIAAAHRRYGTARLLVTCITDTPDVTRKSIDAMREARRKDKSILGIHIEGPHLGEERRGVHKAEHLRALTDQDLALYKRKGSETILLTIAPECVPPPQIRKLRDQGAIIAIGHTQATADQTRGALTAGATGFTHLFNAMGGLNARDQGPAGVALDDRSSWCSIIADGFHVSPEMIRLALRAKQGRIFLVSDAMPPSATDKPQPFQLYGETISPENGRCVSTEGKLAGAILTMAQAVINCITKFEIVPEEALRMASTYPAEFLGLGKSLGKLLPGYEAEVTVLNNDFHFEELWPKAPTL